jgi:hypothetical protein
MIRKDYRLIASALRSACPPAHSVYLETMAAFLAWFAVVLSVTQALAEQNPRFDPARFIEACQP